MAALRAWIPLVVACSSPTEPRGKQTTLGEVATAGALPIPAPPFELQPPTDAIVDLSADCVTRASGHVDCWDTGTVHRLDVDGAIAFRKDSYHHMQCIVRRTGVECTGNGIWTAPKFDAVTDPVDVVLEGSKCVLRRNGLVACANEDSASGSKVVRELRDVTAIAGSNELTCAVDKRGNVACNVRREPWSRVSGLDHVRLLALGRQSGDNGELGIEAVAVHDDGLTRQYVIGRDGDGPLQASGGTTLAALQGATALAITGIPDSNAMLLTAIVGGHVIISDNTTTSEFTNETPTRTLPVLGDAIAITDHCALRHQGSVVCWGDKLGQPIRKTADRPVPVVGVANVQSIATSESDGWAVTRDGRVYQWGGQRTGWATLFDAIHDAAEVVRDGYQSPCFLLRSGRVNCLDHKGEALDMKLANVKALRAGYYGHVALLGDGTATAWSLGESVANVKATRAVEVVGESDLVYWRDAAGKVWANAGTCAGRHDCHFGAATPIAIDGVVELVEYGGDACGRLVSGEVQCWEHSWTNDRPVQVPGVRDAIALSRSEGGFCAERVDGSLWCWGRNWFHPRTPTKLLPVRVLEPGSITGRFDGGVSGCLIQRDRRAACWGHNNAGRLGDGSIVHLDTPAAVPGL